MTLVELITSMTLLMAIGGSMLGLIFAAKSAWQAGNSRSDTRQDIQTTLSQLDADLRDGSIDLVTDATASTPPAICLCSSIDTKGGFVTDTSGANVWQKWVIYYIPTGTTRLLRREATGIADPPIALTLAEVKAWCDGTGTLVTGSATGMTAALDSLGGVTVGLTIQNTNPQGKLERLTSSLYVLPRN